MQININGPSAGRITLIAALESYSSIIKSLTWANPSQDIARVMHLIAGHDSAPTENDLQMYTEEERALFFRNALITNVSGYVDIMIEYLRSRLKVLNNVPEGRMSIMINNQKATRYFYNLGRDTATAIVAFIRQYDTQPNAMTIYDIKRIETRIAAEALYTLGMDGVVAPNPRCDAVLRSLMDFHPVMMNTIAKETSQLPAALADYLDMYINIIRLYFGAVNSRDDEVDTRDVSPVPSHGLCVSNVVVATLPAPCFGLLRNYNNPLSEAISQDAVNYIVSLNDYFMIRQ